MKTLYALVVVLWCGGLAFAQEAPAADANTEDDGTKKGISAVLGKLDWGAGRDDVLGLIRERLNEKYKEQMKEAKGDTIAIDRLLARKRADFEGIKKTFTRFQGQRTGYETSLVAKDFDENGDEALLLVEEQQAQRYYFFKHDRLWKVVVAYSSAISAGVPFSEFLSQATAKFGQPSSRKEDSKDAGRVVSARWEDEITVMTAEDRTDFFGTYVIKYVQKDQAERDAALAKRKSDAAQGGGDPGMEAMLDDITGTTEDGAPTDVVDQLTGTQVEVDLVSGRPEYETLVRAEELRKQQQAQAEAEERREEPAPDPKPEPRKKGKKLEAPGIIF